jgi:hypothetical protein
VFEYSNNQDGWGLGQSVLTGHQGALPLVCLGTAEEAAENGNKKASDRLSHPTSSKRESSIVY